VKLPEPYTYFVDRSLGRGIVVERLRAAGETVHAHDDYFAPNTPDIRWLADVGARGWVVLTKDKNIRGNELERRALVGAGVACFMLGRGDLTGLAMAEAFVGGLPLIRKAVRRFAVPLVASLSASGSVRVLLADGAWLKPPKDLR
jgi:hypothetical protein